MDKTHARYLLIALLALPFIGSAKMEEKRVTYTVDGTRFESTVVYDADEDDRRPGILMIPNWLGPNPASLEKARKVAGDDYVVMMVDMYGVDARPENGGEAGRLAGELRKNPELMRRRAAAALESFLGMRDEIPLAEEHIAAIGFCFGGGAVLEFGRSGADLDAIVSFHGNLASPTLDADAGKTKAKVLVLHGADDPHVPQEEVQAFVAAMRETDVDWTLVQFGNTVHSFTNPHADSPGQSEYQPRSAKRAFEMMEDLFDEVMGDD